MTNSSFATYRIFVDFESARDFAVILESKGLPYFIKEDIITFDPSYAFNPLNKDYRLWLHQEDFEKANKILEEYYQPQLEQVDKNYYLFSFSDEELKEILAKPDEWGPLDYQLAQKILADRGEAVPAGTASKLKQERIQALAEPHEIRSSSIFFAYFSLLIFPLAIAIGWNWAFARKLLPNGDRLPIYGASAQRNGLVIFIIGMILLVVNVIALIVKGIPVN